MLHPTSAEWEDICMQLGYFYEQTVGELNIVGWRNKKGRRNRFEDTISTYIFDGVRWDVSHFPATTRPGVPWLKKLLNPKGTAVLVPGQYVEAFSLGLFRGKSALRQIRPVKVYRDKNQDSRIDLNPATIEEGMFGIHIHRAGWWSKVVGLWSAGCQVFQKEFDFMKFLELCQIKAGRSGNRFTYTLIEI